MEKKYDKWGRELYPLTDPIKEFGFHTRSILAGGCGSN